MNDWLKMTPEQFNTDARPVQLALFAEPDADSLFAADELEGK